MHLHLKDCILDYGPCYSFWCFSFERYNGILGQYHTNNRNIGSQIMRKFIREQEVRSVSFQEFPRDISDIFLNMFMPAHSLSLSNCSISSKMFFHLNKLKHVALEFMPEFRCISSLGIALIPTLSNHILSTDHLDN